ncbi:MAG: DUF4893 domain-containing protein [Aestuariivirga sp.]|uniref:DUF4893 domain-containing protein n=1 Tax=Aestuariivirga sp. TaxID=2650926 RepID=UPI0025BE6A9B|nr:DUF4893 domain-containing protein [Aestuariivirga sp.]MCA3561642.1 DUF4893 domain-containing protein [Aestuariivirga sp.]
MRKIIFSLLVFATATSLAVADGTLDKRLTPFDKDRLAKRDASIASALAEARSGGSDEDVAILDAALAGKPLPLAEAYDPTGNWKCRSIKAGGALPLTVYPWFTCRISEDGTGWQFEKLTGSQRTKGMFYTLSSNRLAYLGAGYVTGEKPRVYGQDAKENQVAVVERRGKNKLVFLFPSPQYESKLDVLVLER